MSPVEREVVPASGSRCIDASVAVKLVLKGEAYRAAARKLFNDSIARASP